MKLQTTKVSEIVRISIIIVLILNFFIIFLEIRYIEYIYLIIFLLYHFFIEITIKKHYENSYNKLRKIVKIKRNFFAVINILIFLQKIRIKLSLNFFKEIIKIFLISGIIYYFPIVCVQILLKII